MSSADVQQPTSDAEPELGSYHAISGAAVAALVLGLASATATIGPVLWVLPVLGCATAAFALRHIERQRPRLIGRKAALLGLGLSVMFLVAGPARLLTRHYWLRVRSGEIADEFLGYLAQQDTFKAHRLTVMSALRRPIDAPLPDPKDPLSTNAYNAFLEKPVVQELRTAGTTARVRLLSVEFGLESADEDLIVRTYEIDYDDHGTPKTLPVQIDVQRTTPRGKTTDDWRIASFGGGPPKSRHSDSER